MPRSVRCRLAFDHTKIGRDPAGPPDAQCAPRRNYGRRRAMAIDMKEPAVRAPWPPKKENDPLYRYPKPYPVGRAKGESFFTIARKHKVGAADLVKYNFQTKNSGEINWYLANYVGCPAPKHGQRYFEFAGAPYDPVKNTGVIFIPMHGDTSSNALNRFGEKIVENYNNTTNKEPGGLCYETCYNRVKVAARAVGVTIPGWNDGSTFSIIWGTLSAQRGWGTCPTSTRAAALPAPWPGKDSGRWSTCRVSGAAISSRARSSRSGEVRPTSRTPRPANRRSATRSSS